MRHHLLITSVPAAALALAPATALADSAGTTWLKSGDGWYAYDALGNPKSGWYQVEGSWYWSDPSGKVATGWRNIDGGWYWLGTSGACKQATWLNQGGTWYYLRDNGAMAKGWTCINGTWYLFSPGGAMLTGWQNVTGSWYYLNGLGAMLTGWQQVGGETYYFNESSGAMARGWVQDADDWYYLGQDGALQRSRWIRWQGEYYFVLASGAAATGWTNVGPSRYYFYPASCVMAHDCWLQDSYVGSDGAMLVSTSAPNGELIGADGLRVVVDPTPYASVPITQEHHGSMPVWRVNSTSASGKVVYYLHGGSFDCGISGGTWAFVNRVAEACSAEVVMPSYPLAPWVTYETAYEQVVASLRRVIAEVGVENVTLMGDSAGGGFASGLIEWMEHAGEQIPERLVLVSPWLDVTCSSAEMMALRNGGWDAGGLIWEGQRWAGESAWATAKGNVRLCPLYGEPRGVHKAVVFWGDTEPFAGDARVFADKLSAAGAEVSVVVGEGLGHDWAMEENDQTEQALAAIADVVR